jgi:trans-aconitate methyltransferase
MDASLTGGRTGHWDDVYARLGDRVSWFQERPDASLSMLDDCGVGPEHSVVDVGGGSSRLIDHLLRRGHTDLTVVDVSSEALDRAAARVPDAVRARVRWEHTDLLSWHPDRQFDVWHDRAALHFLTRPGDQEAYAELVRTHLGPRGLLVVATFAPDGPKQCSGLDVRRYDAASLARLFGNRLTPVMERREEHRTPWGAVQPFTWAAFRHL